MKYRALIAALLLLLGLPSTGTGLPDWLNPAAARAYAEAALIETASSYPVLDLTRLNSQPAILARVGSKGDKVALVVYEANPGSYVVTLVLDQDKVLRVHGRGAHLDPPHKIIKEFYAANFDPSSLLEEG